MARKKGKQLDTRAALLNAAVELGCEHGVERTSVEAIAQRAGLSKGTFFHFFPTKLDLLDAMSEKIALDAWCELGRGLEATEHDPLARLELFFDLSRSWRLDHTRPLARLWRALARDGNTTMLAKARKRYLELACPAFTRLIAEGSAQRQFRVGDIEATAWLVLEWVTASAESNMRTLLIGGEQTIDDALRRLNTTLAAVERVLGAGEGVLQRVQRSMLVRFRNSERPPQAAAPQPRKTRRKR